MSTSDQNIDDIWKTLVAELSRMAGNLAESNKALYWSDGKSSNAAFPFRGFVSFSRRGDPEEEDVVFSLDCKIAGEGLVWSSDLSDGGGMVIADGPSLRIDDLGSKRELQGYLTELMYFLQRSKQVMEDRLK